MSNPYRLLLNITGKINLKRSDKYVLFSNFSIYYTWKNTKLINLEYKLRHGMKNLSNLIDHLLYQ